MNDQQRANIAWIIILWSMFMISVFCIASWFNEKGLHAGWELFGIFALLFSGVAGLLLPIAGYIKGWILAIRGEDEDGCHPHYLESETEE